MADIDKIKELFLKAVDVTKSTMVAEDAAKVRENTDEINTIIEIIVDVFGDGLQLSDITAIGKAVGPAMKLAAGFDDYEGADKKRFVIELVWLVYRTIDTYPSGNSNNINIPFVMGTIERKIERGIITFAAGMAVDALYDRMKESDEV
jgi:hypothetical protein